MIGLRAVVSAAAVMVLGGCVAASIEPITWDDTSFSTPSGVGVPVPDGPALKIRYVTGAQGSLDDARAFEGAFLREIAVRSAGKYQAVADPSVPVDIIMRSECVARNDRRALSWLGFLTAGIVPSVRDVKVACDSKVLDAAGVILVSTAFEVNAVVAGSVWPTPCLMSDSRCGFPGEMGQYVKDRIRNDEAEGLVAALNRLRPVIIARLADNKDARDASTGESGSIDTTSTPPGAKVLIDGAVVGTTPKRIELPVGVYEVTIRFEHELGSSERVRVLPGETVELTHDFETTRNSRRKKRHGPP